MEIKVYKVPFKAFRRPHLLSTHAGPQCLRYNELKKHIPLENFSASESANRFSNENLELFVCLQTSGAKNVLEMKDILKRGEDCQLVDTCDSVESIVNKYSEQRYVALVLKEIIMIDNIPLQENINCILYAENIEERDELRTRYKQTSKVHVSVREEIGDQLCNIMESYVFKAYELKEKYENLYKYLNNHHGKEQSQSNYAGDEILQVDGKHELDESVKILKPLPVPKHGNVIQKRPRSAENDVDPELMAGGSKKRRIGEQRLLTGTQQFRGVKQESAGVSREPEIARDENMHEIYSRVEKKENTIDMTNTNGNMPAEKGKKSQSIEKERTDLNQKAERLRIEMMGLFNRSRVPQEERPQYKDPFDDSPSDALLRELRTLSQSIQGCAFQNRSFLVFIDDECDRDKLKSAIENVLEKHNYVCSVTFATRKVIPFTSCNVGSNITAEFDNGTDPRGGTLGGFGTALSVEGNKTICLTSRHVVADDDGIPASIIKVSENNTNAKVLVDRSFRDRRENVLDIAAVSFEGCNITLNTKYKTSEENPANGRITDYTREQMKGLPVHIWGSITPTGYGMITMSKIYALKDRDMESFIIVEDRKDRQDEKKPFCDFGDSGAIVCADDQDNPDEVHLISMVMGKTRGKSGTYHTLDLKDGIQQVEKEIQPKIELL